MICNFDRPAHGKYTVGDLVLAPLIESGCELTVVDVGARNGMSELPASYARHAAYIGFEPNREEHQKLVEHRTDAARAGIKAPRFHTETYHPTALWSSTGTRDLYLTEVTGACTMMGPPIAEVAQPVQIRTGETLKALPSGILGTEPVECETLDALIPADTTVDYLKVDVEGGEIEVFNGAERLLQRQGALFIKSEFFQLRLYRDQPLFGHQQALLDEAGYRLIDFDMQHPRYVRGETKIPAGADRSMFLAGDAFFAIDPDLNDMSAQARQRLAAISLLFGFNSFAVGLLREAELLQPAEIDAVETALCYVPPLIRAKRAWAELPYAAARTMSRLGLKPY